MKKTLLVKFKDQNGILYLKKKYKYLKKKNTKLKYFDHPKKKKIEHLDLIITRI